MTTDIFANDNMTYGQLYNAVLAVRSPDEAREMFARYVTWLETYTAPVDVPLTTAQIARANIRHLFGYGGASQDQIAMWGIVTGAVHPLGFA